MMPFKRRVNFDTFLIAMFGCKSPIDKATEFAQSKFRRPVYIFVMVVPFAFDLFGERT